MSTSNPYFFELTVSFATPWLYFRASGTKQKYLVDRVLTITKLLDWGLTQVTPFMGVHQVNLSR